MTRLRPRLPHWTAHPGFGVAMLLVLAAILIAHGEPQPSSRPSGTSVAVSGTATAAGPLPSILVIRDGRVEARQQSTVRPVRLPAGVRPLSVVTGRGLSVVLGALAGRQRAYAVSHGLSVRDLGYADAVFPALSGSAAVIVESAVLEPGRLPDPVGPGGTGSPGSAGTGRPTGSTASDSSAGSSGSVSSGSSSPSATRTGGSGPPELRDFQVRRFDSSANPVEPLSALPPGTMVGTDTSVGLVVWQPVNRVFDNGVAAESLSAAATLIRPDNSLRSLGPVHPLTADRTDLLVWDVVGHRFGLMPLAYATSTATTTASPLISRSGGPDDTVTAGPTGSPTPTSSPTTVAGVRWFLPTRGLLVTGPASFSPDSAAFAVYAQVGARRRLVVAEPRNIGTDLVEVLALAQPLAKKSPSATPSGSATGSSSPGGSRPAATTATNTSASRSATATSPVVEADGYPIEAPLAPAWWNGMAVGLGTTGVVVGYRPGSTQSALLDLGFTDIEAFSTAP